MHMLQYATVKDSLIVKISSDCGTTWTRPLLQDPMHPLNVFATHAPMSTSFFPQSDYDWCGSSYGTSCYQLDISPWAGQRNIKILFESYNRHGNNLFLDNISISGPTGIQDAGNNREEIRIYPNPTTGFVNVLSQIHLPELICLSSIYRDRRYLPIIFLQKRETLKNNSIYPVSPKASLFFPYHIRSIDHCEKINT